jgi:hypothetical protein
MLDIERSCCQLAGACVQCEILPFCFSRSDLPSAAEHGNVWEKQRLGAYTEHSCEICIATSLSVLLVMSLSTQLACHRASQPEDGDAQQPAADDAVLDSLDDADAAADARASWQPAWLAPQRQHVNGNAQHRTGRSRPQHTVGAKSADRHVSGNSQPKSHTAVRPPTADVQCQTPCHAHVQTDASAPPDGRLAAGSSWSDSVVGGQAASGAGRLKDDAAQRARATEGGAADAAAPRGAAPELTCYRVTVWTADMAGCYTEGRPRIVLFSADGNR